MTLQVQHADPEKKLTDHVEQPQKPEIENVEGEVIDKKAQRRLVLKLDLIILPLLALSIMMGYLDRGNIGNARLLGMAHDLKLSEQQYLNCVMMFFLGYMLIELPAGMALRYIQPRYVFATALISFGLFSTLITVSGYAGIMVLRVLIGLGEAFVNNAYLYVSLYYMQNELSLRTGKFNAAVYSMTPVAGAFSGLLAYGVGTGLEGAHDIPSWRWLFIIEGAATIGFGFIVLALLPGLPETVAAKGSFLFPHEQERALIMQRLRMSQNTSHAGFQKHQVVMAFKDPKLYLGALLLAPVGIGIGAFNVFLPTFVNQFGFDRLHSQLISIIPYACALISMIFISWLSDRLGRKALVCICSFAVGMIGFIILITATGKVVLLVGACLVAIGTYPGLVIGIAWTLTVHGGYTKKATFMWASQVMIQTYSIIATQVYRSPPRFFLGHGIALGLYVLGITSAMTLWYLVSRQNRMREARRLEFEQKGEVDPDMEKSFEELGDFHPGWRYTT
ncbi:uncharacterized protein HMPREF1541_06180 [Cyphellophora europaea CBS 101466]|uniref:Major facilitator superfamily (MFS) profile domain-containing protein n=1 Tax=Cyphellophora europaea (strain CBS 101466) TaxID=1220924 RepID=W2RW21_CYPE1|nr:uncharacterized protein HMPREF1541_06180 [Cyphellophora europaea CBS 101466]ETN39953.1 hypothetical protein HMPREF1541_06180 [Cyphellophora europaea CBS 101466]